MSAKAADNQLGNEPKKIAPSILNMFHTGIIHLVERVNIDRPTNAIILTGRAPECFGLFHITFESMGGSTSSAPSYRIHSPNLAVVHMLKLPVTRTLFLSPNCGIDPPLPTLTFSASGNCKYARAKRRRRIPIDRVIRHMEELSVRNDGSTELGRIISLR
ncbi:hypothetical protein ACJ72_03620 [Emergomyces africanus]|uniref:Uncharacterized protein n=1 Tax=Emergomyces africanus TaxID=1955775 RepID=A0A1B7NZ28_9EURO|nr:hypothetical protein ACJ72_03620 [Emergomyces africanus]